MSVFSTLHPVQDSHALYSVSGTNLHNENVLPDFLASIEHLFPSAFTRLSALQAANLHVKQWGGPVIYVFPITARIKTSSSPSYGDVCPSASDFCGGQLATRIRAYCSRYLRNVLNQLTILNALTRPPPPLPGRAGAARRAVSGQRTKSWHRGDYGTPLDTGHLTGITDVIS
ncbi:hypothetical protein K0M31_002804 [Melipona bicolor]|uniref:Uncharacterized protein n=1 Tax=Melipona bicolor TaxID=60889 RepID=A0AA40KPV0_9HYME|nr:hypothetical protein K0M31_002804 [Melipona bicolor]